MLEMLREMLIIKGMLKEMPSYYQCTHTYMWYLLFSCGVKYNGKFSNIRVTNRLLVCVRGQSRGLFQPVGYSTLSFYYYKLRDYIGKCI